MYINSNSNSSNVVGSSVGSGSNSVGGSGNSSWNNTEYYLALLLYVVGN